MRKIIFLVVIVVLLLGIFYSCQSIEYEFRQPLDQVQRVFLIVERNDNEERTECPVDILMDIKALPCYDYWNDPSHTIGDKYVLIEYADGSTEVISARANYYERDGKIRYGRVYFDTGDFFAVFKKYQTGKRPN